MKRLPPLTIWWVEQPLGAHLSFFYLPDYDGVTLRDSRGRLVGVRLRVEPHGVAWNARPQATRNGAAYGPVQPTRRFDSLLGAKAYLEYYARRAHARYARQFGRPEPINLQESLKASLAKRSR